MKKTKLFIFTLLSTIIFFPACSNKSENIKKVSLAQPVSIYKIMGITEPTLEPIHSQTVQNQPLHHYQAPMVKKRVQYIEPIISNPEPYVSPDIEFISYQHTSPVRQMYSRVNNQLKDLLNGIESSAKSFLGTPYVWGATGPSKFDCSGFTQWVYRDSGINIPRVSRDQAKVGEYVRYENLRRGDMVFFDTKKHRSGKVTHVGIYLGNNNFIHASSAGKKVVIYNFNKKNFYKRRFLWGRRVTNQPKHYASN
jgi:cell wall-associated NlpC family hydrolase